MERKRHLHRGDPEARTQIASHSPNSPNSLPHSSHHEVHLPSRMSSIPYLSVFRTNPPVIMLATAAAAATSWLHSSRSRFFFLLLCSPLLVPIFCATLPFICAIELCIRLVRYRRRICLRDSPEIERLRRCEEGGCRPALLEEIGDDGEEVIGLLQRYLDDQLLLVRSVYECGDGGKDLNGDARFCDIKNSNLIPLLA